MYILTLVLCTIVLGIHVGKKVLQSKVKERKDK